MAASEEAGGQGARACGRGCDEGAQAQGRARLWVCTVDARDVLTE